MTASIEDPVVIKKILEHFDRRAGPATPAVSPVARAPPQMDGRRSQVASALAAQTTYEPIARFAPSLIWHGYDVAPQFRAPDVRDALTGLTIFRRRATAP